MASRRHCAVPCCGEKIGSMYLFPKDPVLREKWRSACKIIRSVSNYMRVCSRHFRADDVDSRFSGRCSRLKSEAVPRLNLPDSIRRKGRRNCIIYTCQKDESQDVTLHFFPKNTGLRHKWASVCKVPGKVSRNTRVCSSHFSEDDFVCVGRRFKSLKSGVTPSRNLPVSYPSRHKSKQWSLPSNAYKCDDNEIFDLFTDGSACESEGTWIQRFICEEQ